MAADSTHEDILEAFAARLATLDLDGLEARRIERWQLEGTWGANARFPCLAYAPAGSVAEGGGITSFSDFEYPIALRLCSRLDAQQDPRQMRQHLKWRQTIEEAFNHVLLTGADGDIYAGQIATAPTYED